MASFVAFRRHGSQLLNRTSFSSRRVEQPQLLITGCARKASSAVSGDSEDKSAEAIAGLGAVQAARAGSPAFWRGLARKMEEAPKKSKKKQQQQAPFRAPCKDPYAECLAEAFLSSAARSAVMSSPGAEARSVSFSARAAFMDRFVMDAVGRRTRQVVLLGSGSDTRPFRLDVPPQLTYTEVDAASVHEVRSAAATTHSLRRRAAFRRLDFDIAQSTEVAPGTSGKSEEEVSEALVEALSPAVKAARGAGVLFLLDEALEAWPEAAQRAAVAAVAKAAPAGSVLVGPAPTFDAIPLLQEAGFQQTNLVNHENLQKIFGLPILEGTSMLVAMKDVEDRPGPKPPTGSRPGPSVAARELRL